MDAGLSLAQAVLLDRDTNGTSWPINCGEIYSSNGISYHTALSMPSRVLFPGADKDFLKQKMLEHESVYKNQVFERHRLYRVQKNLMDDVRKREQYEGRTWYETSSSSNGLPSQMTPDYVHRQNSSRLLYTNSASSSLPASNPEFIRSSACDIYKGKGVQDARTPFKNCASPNSLEPRPAKLRKMIDLELPGDMYVDIDEDQCYNRMTCDTKEKLITSQHEKTSMFLETCSESDSRLRKRYALADLNEPPEAEETIADPPVNVLGVHRQDKLTKDPIVSEDVLWKTKHLNFNSSQSSSDYSTGNGQNWFYSALKAERNKGNGRTIHQTNQSEMPYRPVQVAYENHQRSRAFPPHPFKEDSLLAKQNNDSIMYGKSNTPSSVGNPGRLTSPQPSYAYSSNLVNSWNLSSEKSGNHLSQKPMSAQMTPFPISESLSQSFQSSAQGNNFPGVWHKNAIPRSKSGFQSETPVNKGFYHGSSSDRYKEVSAHFSKAGIVDYGSGSRIDNASSNSFLKATGSIDLNSRTALDLNVVPNDLSNESLTWQGEAKKEDSVPVVHWLRASASDKEAILRSRNGPDKPKNTNDPREMCNRHEVSNTLDHQSCLTSTSSNIDATRGKEKVISGVPIFQAPVSREQEIDSGKIKLPFDINVAFEEFDSTATTTNEVTLVERIESRGFRSMIDLNSCVTEDEIPSWTSLTNSSTTTNNSPKKPERCMIIDLEAPANMEAEEEGSCSVLDEESMLRLAREAAEAIVAISVPSSSAPHNQMEDALSWFADEILSSLEDVETCPDTEIDCLSSESDSFEEMNLRLMGCSVEEYFPNPPDFKFLGVEEAAVRPTFVTGQTARRTRRGRQRRDFQRDILPGITSLARHEITEDIQTFGGLMRATGYVWNCGGRKSCSRNGSGRGRRRKQVQVPPPVNDVTLPPPLTPEKQSMNNGEMMIGEDRSLTGWGKTTRRPRRQRSGPSSR
ncbi:hypothetical protein V2J09_004120 [Rumex salicifolius]